MLNTVPHRAALALVAFTLFGCGARSELIGPRVDVASEDAAVADVAPPCRGDADCDDGVECTVDRCDLRLGRCSREGDDAFCNDGLFCTGSERCDPSAGCVSSGVVCGDSVACTRDSCDEEQRRCVRAPDDALCPISHRCDPDEGCLARAFAHGAAGLFEVLLPAARVRTIAPVRTSLTDIALHPDRTLYGIGSTGLYQLDADTGATTLLLATPLPFASLDATPDGALYAAAQNTLYRIDVGTMSVVAVAEFPPGLESSGDLAVLEGRLLATARTDSTTTDDTLVELHTDRSAPPRVIGNVGTGCVWGLAAFGPTLYGFSCMGQVLRIDAQTGRSTVLALSSTRFYGATAR